MNELPFLERIWLSEKPAKCYLALLDLWDASISDIARKARIHRAEAYKALPILKEYRLINAIEQWKRILYRAASPEKLKKLQEELVESSHVAIERLLNKYDSNNLKATIEHVKWVDAIAGIYVDAMKKTPTGGTYFRYSSGRVLYERSMYTTLEYTTLKARKNVGRQVISNGTKRYQRDPDPNREVVTIPKEFDLFDDNISKLIYEDSVAIIDHDSKEAFIIESPRFAEFEKKLFRLLFKFLQKR